jgi:hypothetical protein
MNKEMPVSIRLTRNSDPKNDDVIIIRKRLNHSDFLIRYVDCHDHGCDASVTTKGLNETMIYLKRIFMYLNKERDPFCGIQCNVPGYPIIFLPIQEFLEDIQISVLDSIYETLVKPPSMIIQ